MADREDEDARGAPGPIPLPADLRQRDPRWAWGVAVAVMVLALVLYGLVRSPGGAPMRHAAPPVWGDLTLAKVAMTEARAAGDRRPAHGVWVGARRADALQLLANGEPGTAESEYVVDLSGHFRAAAGGTNWLSGSAPTGTHLILLVRAFDGVVDGRMITGNPGPDLGRLGSVVVLRLGWL